MEEGLCHTELYSLVAVPSASLTIQLSAHASLGIHGEALVEPEFPPVSIGHQVTEPAVTDLMHNDVCERAVTRQQAGCHKRQAGVLHSTEWEGGRHEQHIIPRAA